MAPVPATTHPPFSFASGCLLLVNKPKDWTSFDVVNKLRFAIKRHLDVKKIKVGHAGTLDPMATGLLCVCTGKWTKRLQELQGMDKSYTGTIKLGATTPSYDAETEEDEQFPTEHLTEEKLVAEAQNLTGDLEQFPPIFSAIKVDGQPLYKKARQGIKVEVKPRPVTVHKFELMQVQLPEVKFVVDCSKGTYIRSLAHDLGKQAGSGGYLTALCRTSIGPYQLADAWELDDLVKAIDEIDQE